MNQALNRSVTLYYAEVGHTRPVNNLAEEQRLIALWQNNQDTKARDALLEGHLRFVVKMARNRSRDPEKLEDLIAAGNLGLVKALDRYDLSRRPAVRFLTYAGAWINKEMLDNDYSSSLVHVPTHRQKAQRKKAKQFQKALQKHGPDSRKMLKLNPGLPEGVTVGLDELREGIETCHRIEASGHHNRSKPSWLTDNDVSSMSTTLPENASTDSVVRHAIDKLSVREQTVLNLYYGVKDEPRNLVQIAALLEMSPERIRQIKIAGVKQLRSILADQHNMTAACDAY